MRKPQTANRKPQTANRKPQTKLAISIILSALSLNTYAAPCDSNFSSQGNFITGTTYKTYADLPNTNPANAYEGALADIAKEPSWKIIAQDKQKGLIQAVQAAQYDKGKVIPLNINIVSAGNGAKVTMDYVTPTGSLSPAAAVKSQFCQTIAAAGSFSGAVSDAKNKQFDSQVIDKSAPIQSSSIHGLALITSSQNAKISKELSKKVTQKQMHDKIAEASKTIQPFLEMHSCITEYSDAATSPQNIYASLGMDFRYKMIKSQYHDAAQCYSVARINAWSSPALNALQFEVLFLAEDSGETKNENHELVKQPDGEWLFTR